MSAAQEVIVVKAKRTGVVAGIVAGVLALLGIFSVGLIFVPLAVLVALVGSIVALKNFNIGGLGTNILAWALIAVGVAVSPGIWVALALIGAGAQNAIQANAGIKAQLEEGYNLTGGARAAVSEYYYDQGSFPANNYDAGLAPAYEIQGLYTSSVNITDGSIFVAFGSQAAPQLANSMLLLMPNLVNGHVEWECHSDIQQSHLPSMCTSVGSMPN